MGKDRECIFLIEPDFWQYYGHSTQKRGSLSGAYMRALFNDMVKEIKTALPKAIISWDISAWIGVTGMRNWWGFFRDHPEIKFVHTSGGQVVYFVTFLFFTISKYSFLKARGDLAEIKPGELKWREVSQITGKRIIADCGT